MSNKEIKLGLKENIGQFMLLVIINAFVGGMIGLERSILPKIAETDFHITTSTIILSFIILFGIFKAGSNYLAGSLANKFGKKKLLVAGWIFGIPVPFILMFAQNWNWIIAANILLGINQGLAWSSTVMMKIDLVGEKQRGFAMGINEFAGYLSVAIVAFFTGWVAANYGLRPYPFYIGIVISIIGFFLSLFFVSDTQHHVNLDSVSSEIPKLKNVFWETTWKNKNLGSVTQAGLINNLNDALLWGILPIVLASKNFSLQQIAIVVAIYPAVWGIVQLLTGKMSDTICKKDMLYTGMLMQGTALLVMIFASSVFHFIILSVVLGIGTAMVYPVFLATIAENTNPADRANSIGIFRLWRDSGYAIGAVLAGITADVFGMNAAFICIGFLTIFSGILIYFRMFCNNDNSIKLYQWILRIKIDQQKNNKNYHNLISSQ